MSDHSLPKNIDPLKYADQAKVLEGIIKLNQLPRFCNMLVADEGDVKVKLEFGRDQQGLRVVEGLTSVEVLLQCERCLEPVAKEITSEFTLGIVLTDDDAKQLPRSYEPIIVEPDFLDVNELIEEELILSLPMFAYHEQCSGEYEQALDQQGDIANNESDLDGEGTRKDNPFSVLANLKTKKS